MSRGLKKFFIICAILVGIGLILSIIGFVAGGIKAIDKMADRYDWIHGSPGRTEYVYIEDGAPFNAVEVKGNVDVVFYQGDSTKTRIGYGKNEKVPKFHVENGVLKVEATNRSDGGVVNLSGKDSAPTLEVYCSDDESLSDVNIDISCGDVLVNYLVASNITVNTDLGDVELYNINFNNANIKVDAGDIKGNNITSGGIHIENNLGDCELGGEFKGTTDINVDSGDIDFYTSLLADQYTFSIDVSAGDLNMDGHELGSMNQHYRNGSGSNKLNVKCNLGDVDVHLDSTDNSIDSDND